MRRYFGAPVIRKGFQPARHHAPHHGYWNHAYRANNAMPAYGFSMLDEHEGEEEDESDDGFIFGETEGEYDILPSDDEETGFSMVEEHGGTEEADLNDLLKGIRGSQVKTKSDFEAFALKVGEAAGAEGKTIDVSGATGDLGSKAKIASAFGKLKKIAEDGGAKKTGEAVTDAASWYWCNVEDPEACKKAQSGGGRTPTGKVAPPAGKGGARPFYKQTWFYWTAGIVGALVVFGVPTGIMVSKKRKKKSA